jgi:hypothetical protein
MPREGISSVRGTRFIDELNIVLLTFSNVSGNMGPNFVCVLMELEVCVIGNHKHWVGCAFKQVIPMFQTSDDSQEFPIIDRVTLFSCREGLGMVSAWAKD